MRVFIAIFHGRGPGGTGHDKALIGVIVERTTAAQQNMSSMQEEALEELRMSQVGLFSTVHLYLQGEMKLRHLIIWLDEFFFKAWGSKKMRHQKINM